MKKLFLVLAAVFIAACSTIPESPAVIANKYCPTIETAILIVELHPDVSPENKLKAEDIKEVMHYICHSPDVQPQDLVTVANNAIPVLIEIISGMDIAENKKQAAILTLVIAQATMLQAR